MPLTSPRLWIVATPLGNPGDLSPRAREILENADLMIVSRFRGLSHGMGYPDVYIEICTDASIDAIMAKLPAKGKPGKRCFAPQMENL